MKLLTSVVLGFGLILMVSCGGSRSPLFTGSGSESADASSLRKVRSGERSNISEIYAGSCKQISRGGFIWMTDSFSLADLVAPLGNNAAAEILRKVSFDSQGALMVDFGEMPSPDFNVKLMNKQLQLDGPRAILQVDLIKPSASANRAPQVVTHPCAIYAVPSVGYTTLEIQSELGDVFTSFEN